MIQQEMLEYQSIDRELNRIEKELKKNEFFVRRKQYKSLHQSCEENMLKSESKATDLNGQLAQARQNMAAVKSALDEYCKEIVEVEDADELNYLTKKLNEELESLSAIEKDIKRISREGEEIVKTLEDINAKLPKIIALYAKCNEEFNKASEAQKPRVIELKTKQTELKKAIAPSLFEIYKKVSDGQIQPVFVPLRDGNRCGGCQMEMPKAIVDAQFANKDYMRCEHCGRIIYKAE
ncbi:MAG: C4-type zinc ribbon domain-containing protein [Corallococcus sp.]|nr:C4-type zinc ribbon domain-containing protein [Corallococcus sp.]